MAFIAFTEIIIAVMLFLIGCFLDKSLTETNKQLKRIADAMEKEPDES